MAVLIVTDPDGTDHRVDQPYAWKEFSGSTKRCDVRLGPFTFSGDLRTYRMKGEANGLGTDLTLTGLVQPFRPGTGIFFLGDTDHYQAWMCAVPSGTAKGTITVNGRQRSFTGRGYHDHSWSNLPFPYFMEHRRWARGSIGHYAAIGVAIHLRDEYDSAFIPVFLVDDTATGRRVAASFSPQNITANESDPRPHRIPPTRRTTSARSAGPTPTDHARQRSPSLMGRITGRFKRVEPRRRVRRLVLGLLSDLPRKNCWTIAEWAGETIPDGMQHLLGRAKWDAEAVRDERVPAAPDVSCREGQEPPGPPGHVRFRDA